MAKEATAKVTFTLENAEEVLTLLRQLKSFVDGGGGAGGSGVAGPSPAPGTASGSGTAAPPVGPAPTNPVTANVGANAQAMPQNTPFVATAGNSGGMFGTWNGSGFSNLMYDPIAQRFFDPQNGSYYLGGSGFGFGGPGGPGKPATPPAPPGAGAQFMGAMAAYGVGQQVAAVGGQMAGMYTSSLADGSQFYPQRLLPGLTTIGMIGAGALIGGLATSWSGPGALVGAGIGAVVAGIGGDAMKPLIENQINLQELNRLQRGLGFDQTTQRGKQLSWGELYLGTNPFTMPFALPGIIEKLMSGEPVSMPWEPAAPNDMIEARMRGLKSGRYLGEKTYQGIQDAYPDSPIRRAIETDALERARYSTGNVIRYGLASKDEDLSLKQKRDLLLGNAYGNELENAQALENMGLVRQASKVRESARDRMILEEDLEGGGAEMGLAQSRFNRAARYKGSAGAKAASGEYQGAVANQAALMRQQAAKLALSDPGKSRALMAQATQLEEEAADTVADTIYANQVDEAMARGQRAVGQADRSFDTALYGGQSANSLPWDQRAGAYRTQARELQRLMAERGDRLSPAERMRMQEQVDALNFKADFEVPRQREGMVNQEKISTTGLENAQAMSREMPAILRGSAVDQTRQYELQADALARVRSTYEEILRTSRYLTMEQKIQYQTQIENLKVDEERARVSGIYAKNAAVRMTGETANVEAGLGPMVRLIRGAGGAQGAAAQAELLGLTDANIALAEQNLQDNIAAGMSPNSKENMAIRREITSMKGNRENQMRGLAIAPMSAQDRARRSDLSTEAAFYERGYGTFGDIRGNLLAQIEMVEKRMGELEANRTKIRSGKVAGVTWTDAMEADYTEAKNAAALEALGLSEQYNYGYDQRLISEAYNMSGMGRLGMTRFTRREAAAMGVFHRALGGSEEQTRKMREMYPAMTRAMGSGNPMNFADRAIAGGEGRASVEVLIRVQDGTGRIRDNDIQVVNQKTSQDMNVNVQAAKRASG